MSASRRGVTLVELLVAMFVSGVVVAMAAGWIVHAARASSDATRFADRADRMGLLRDALFQDAHRGPTLRLEREAWTVGRTASDSGLDSVVWTWGREGVFRSGRAMLGDDSVLEASLRPVFGDDPSASDPFLGRDRDLDGRLSGSELAGLAGFELRVVSSRRRPPREAPLSPDTLVVRVACAGPG